MVARIISFLPPQWRNSDWTTEEIAELYRIEHALVQARISVDVDRGITDEGDPWFVFCRPDGEVLVHISRVQGLYYLHSPGLPSALSGRSFSALSKAFVGQLPVQIPMRRAGNAELFVHPAAMLAVIIGTIFVAADQLRLDPQAVLEADDDGHHAHDPSLAKGGLQAAFHHYLEQFLGSSRGENSLMSSSTYMSIISTVAAFVIGSLTAFGPLKTGDATTFDLASQDADAAVVVAVDSDTILADNSWSFEFDGNDRSHSLASAAPIDGAEQNAVSDRVPVINVASIAAADSTNAPKATLPGAEAMNSAPVVEDHAETKFSLSSSMTVTVSDFVPSAAPAATSNVVLASAEKSVHDGGDFAQIAKLLTVPANYFDVPLQVVDRGTVTVSQVAVWTPPAYDKQAEQMLVSFLRANSGHVSTSVSESGLTYYAHGVTDGAVHTWAVENGQTITIVGSIPHIDMV